MGQETYPSPEKLRYSAYLNLFIEKGITFLLIFTPLAFGTVQEWSVSVMEAVVFLLFGVWLFKTGLEGKYFISWNIQLSLLTLLILVAVAQIVPLPEPVLSAVSLSTANTYKTLMDNAGSMWLPISLYPDATKAELFKIISYTVLFFVIINHYRTVEQIKDVVRVVVYMGCFLAVFAVLQKMTWNGRMYWFYPIADGLAPMGPYINRNHFAAYMEMAVPMGLGLLFYESAKIRAMSYLPPVKRITRLLDNKELIPMTSLFLGIVIMAAAIFLCLSRGGITGFAVSILFFTAMTRTRRGLRNRTVLLSMLGVTLLFSVVVASWSRIEDRFGEKDIHRMELWEDTARTVRDFPALGTGFGTFNSIYPRYQTRHPQLIFDHAHNDYIEALTDTGFIGFIITAGTVLTFFYTVIRGWRIRHNTFVKCIGIGGISSCIAMAVHSFTDFNMRIPANALLLTTIAAITYAAIYNVSSSKAE